MSFCVQRSMYTRTPLTVRRATMTGIICGPAHTSATVAGNPSGSSKPDPLRRSLFGAFVVGKKVGIDQH